MRNRRFNRIKNDILNKGAKINVEKDPILVSQLLETDGIIELSGFGNGRSFGKDPKYKKPFWAIRHPAAFTILVAVISGVISLLVNIADRAMQTQSEKEQDNEIQELRKRIDSVAHLQMSLRN
jgi:hypothetical protein